MKRVLALIGCLLAFGAQAQYEVGTGELPANNTPDDVMPPGKVFVNPESLPVRRVAQSDATIERTCTGTLAVAPCNTAAVVPDRAIVTAGNGGQFRIGCSFSHAAFDDPIIHPRRTGWTHLHQFFGNDSTGAGSDITTFATTGKSTCVGGTYNRSAYWFPVFVYECVPPGDGTCNTARHGEIIVARNQDGIFYYKTNPGGTTIGSEAASYGGAPVQWPPSGFSMITGCTVAASCLTALTPNTGFFFDCYKNGVHQGGSVNGRFYHIPSTAQALAIVGSDGTGCNEIKASVKFLNCWNGVDLNTPTGKGHIAAETGNACPDPDFPIFFPGIEANIFYDVTNADLAYIRLSSDLPKADAILAGCTSASNYCAGYTAHGDWVNGWNQTDDVVTANPTTSWGMTITEAILQECYMVLNNPATPKNSDCHSHLLGSPLGDTYWWGVYRP